MIMAFYFLNLSPNDDFLKSDFHLSHHYDFWNFIILIFSLTILISTSQFLFNNSDF